MKVVNMQIDQVIPYDNNPRDNEDAVEPTANSIKEFGFQQPIVVDKDNVVIVGHTRLLAAKSLNMTEVPVVVADTLTVEQVKAYRLADNKTNEFADWDLGKLENELDSIDDLDMNVFGFEDNEIDDSSEETDISDKLTEKFQIVINCDDENELQETFSKLTEEGYDCDISTL